MKKLLLLSLFILGGCSSSSNSTTDPQNTSVIGAWAVQSVQCTVASTPRSIFECWKSAIVGLGEITIAGNALAEVTLFADGTFSGSVFPSVDTLPLNISACLTNHTANNQTVSGVYTASAGQLSISVLKNTVTWSRYNETEIMNPSPTPAIGTYSINGNTMTVTLNLPDNSKWKATLTR